MFPWLKHKRQLLHIISGLFCFNLISSQCNCQVGYVLKAKGTTGKQQQGVDASFVDGNGNRYESANFNFCPSACSCLDDYFECKKASLKQIPALPKWVRSLDLTGNKLDDGVENSIANLTELVSLNLKKNRLQRIPVFKGLLSLEKLILAHNKIQGLTIESFLSMPNLKELDLSKNAIRTILPNTFPVTNRLTFLNLNFNTISSLEENSFEMLKGLIELHVNHNRLTSLPAGIFKALNSLQKLDLSDNRIDITWSTFKGLDGLRVLKLRSNGIGNLADGVFHALKSVVTIELDSNRITVLNRQGFFNLTSLISLTLSNNSIWRIEPDTWEFTQQLQILDLAHNNLTELGRHNLEYLGRLQKLNLGHNNIHHISEGVFDATKNLDELNLNSNKLSWIIEDASGPFKSLRRLQKLDLSRNNATSINQKAFIGLQALQALNLAMNNLTTVQYNAFESLQQLQKLILNSDHFLCDCNLEWFYIWLRASRLAGQVSVVCDYPVNLRGRELLSLKEEDFMCSESPKPRLIKEPVNQLAIKGTNVTLECLAISSLPAKMTIQWKRDNIDVPGNETDTKTSTTLSNNNTLTSGYLHLVQVGHDHTGKYQCIASNSFGTTYSKKFKITVATYPGFRKVPSNVTLNIGSTARLDCSAYGEPTPQIAWQKDGGNDFPAARERRMHVMPTDDAFFIINAKASDMGVYTCTAENPAGIIKANATLIVHEAPAFVRPMRSKEVNTGQSSVLECMSSGSPKPTLRWYKDDELLHLTERHFFAAEGQLLIIVDTQQSDAGVYKCEIENELGTVSGLLTLKVNKAILKSVVNVEEVTGIVIITVFCCAVGTSVIWVVIIYQAKRASSNSSSDSNNGASVGLGTDYNSNVQNANANDTIPRTENYLHVQPQDESRYRLLIPSQPFHNSQVINVNNIENNSDIPHEVGPTDEIEFDYLSNKDSGKPSSNSAEDVTTLNSSQSQSRLNYGDASCQVNSFERPVVIYRSANVLCNNNNKPPPLQNKRGGQRQPRESNSVGELSTPLMTDTNEIPHVVSISTPSQGFPIIPFNA